MNIFPVCRVRSKAPMEKRSELSPVVPSVGKDISRITSCEEFWINIQQCLLVVLKPHSSPAQRSQFPALCAPGKEFLAFGTSCYCGGTLQQHHWVILTGPEICSSSQGAQSKGWTIVLYIRRYQVQRVLTVNLESLRSTSLSLSPSSSSWGSSHHLSGRQDQCPATCLQ